MHPIFVFFGTDEFSVIVLEELKVAGFTPSLIVTAPDKPKGRGLALTPPPVKERVMNYELGIRKEIKVLQPEKLDSNFTYKLKAETYDLFIVASYGKILPKEILEIPKHGTLNVHPSLLPLFRGSSPIQSQIIVGAHTTGVTIILMDNKIDHGPIVAQKTLQSSVSPPTSLGTGPSTPFRTGNFSFLKLRDVLAHEGGKLLAETIPEWLLGNINAQEQEHDEATYTKKITKDAGLIDLNSGQALNYRKFLAYTPWPGVYFYKNEKRIKITDAEYSDGKFVIKKVIPEGQREVGYKNFLHASPTKL